MAKKKELILGIDLGITMLMIENYRTAFAWNTFMLNQEAQTAMQKAGFQFAQPEGAYYFFVDFSPVSKLEDVAFATWLTEKIGIATVPGSSFYRPGAADAKRRTRFAFCKKMATLEEAVERLKAL